MYIASSFIDLLLYISVGGGVGDGSEGGLVGTRTRRIRREYLSDGEGVRSVMMSGANRRWKTSSGDGERFLSKRRRCIETEGDDEREAFGVCSEAEESASLDELLRVHEGSSSSSSTTIWLPSPDDS